MELSRTPPHSKEAEIAVLGGLLCSAEASYVVFDILSQDDFYTPAHRFIFAAMYELWRRAQPIDIITVSNYLKETDKLEFVGGIAYLSEIQDLVGTAANIEYHAQIVRDKAVKRALLVAADQIIGKVYSETEADAKDIVTAAEQLIFQVGQERLHTQIRKLDAILTEVYADFKERIDQGRGLDLITPGFANLARGIGGFRNGSLILLAARPSMGKTTLALILAEKIARSQKKHALFISLEDSAKQLIWRMISYTAEVDGQRIALGQLSDDDKVRIGQAVRELSTSPILFDEGGGLTLPQICSRARRMKVERDICMLVVDYLQLIATPPTDSRRYQSREQEIADISRTLKNLARELDIPILACAQLNRDPEKRIDKRPSLADLRESGALEQDADMIMMLYRPEYYFRGIDEIRSYTELIVSKNRHGPTPTVFLSFLSSCAKFNEWEGAIPDVRAIARQATTKQPSSLQ